MKILTIGHSNRPIDDFLHMLRAHGVARLIDIRTIPKSRHNPQFNQENLKTVFSYTHMPGLGGLRHPRKDSINAAWRNDSFRGYADYMGTDEFRTSLDELVKAGEQEQIAIMCAESVPWRCHRSLVADALTARGIAVEHIMSATSAKPHTLTPFAHVHGVEVTYPALAESQPG